MRSFVLLLMAACLAAAPADARSKRAKAKKKSEPRAKQVLLVEYPSIRVIRAKNAKEGMRPSSMTKLMTTLIVFEALETGKAKEDELVTVSKTAARARGSRVPLKAGRKYRFGDLMRAMIVYSANNATVALAEHLAGSEAGFAEIMNRRAREIGLLNSNFRNATGFTADNHKMSAEDIARLAGLIIAKYPRRYPIFARRKVRFGKKNYRNRNPVLGRVKGADGLKTGQTRAGGYGLVASAKQGDRRLILVINGLKSSSARRREAVRLFKWGFKQPAGQE